MEKYIGRYVEITRKASYMGKWNRPCRGTLTPVQGSIFGKRYTFHSNDDICEFNNEELNLTTTTYSKRYTTSEGTWGENYTIKILEE